MTKSKEENSYKNILKGTSAFGGVQVFQILVGLVRGKFVAMLLGPAGMGISALYFTAATTLQQFASLGLNLGIVKEVAANKDNPHATAHIFAVARRLIGITAMAGAIACILLSPLLSQWTFGTDRYTLGFILLSLMVFFSIAGAGELSLLQGLREVKRLSRASIVGAVTGLVTGVPLYYFFGNAGIVPAMILLPLSTYIFYRYSLYKSVRVDKVNFDWQSHKPMVRKLISLGLVLMAGTLIGSFTNYLINMFVRHFGSVDNVGLYQAANSITNQYVGVVFSAMALDYFPRLSAIAGDNTRMREVVNRQTEIVSLVLTPLVTGLILTSPIIIKILLTDSFMEIMPLMRWMGLGILVRGLNYPMGYITFAKDDKRLFFRLEAIMSNAVNLLMSCAGYYLFGLIGLGMSLVASSAVSYIVYYYINGKKYAYSYDRKTVWAATLSIIAGTATFAASFIADTVISYSLMAMIFTITCIVAIIRIKKVISRQ